MISAEDVKPHEPARHHQREQERQQHPADLWVALHPMAPQQGGPHARYTRLRPARPLLLRPGLLPPHLPTLPGPDHRRRPHHRPPHRLQPPPHRRRTGPRPPLQLSPRPLPAPLVLPGWRGSSPGSSSTIGPPTGPSPWRATTPSTSTAAPRSTARAAIATRSARPTATPPTAGGTNGSSWPSWSSSPSPPRPWALPVLGGAVPQPGEGPEGEGPGPEAPAHEGQGPDQGQGQGASRPPRPRPSPKPRPRGRRSGPRGLGGTRRPRN